MNGLSKRFGGVQALQDVTFAIESRTCTAVIGPNGAGKSTLIDVISGLQTHYEGEVEVLLEHPRRTGLMHLACKGLSRTFQDVRVVRQVSVKENVLLAESCPRQEHSYMALFSRAELMSERSKQLLNEFELDGRLAEDAGKLSYGQQKLLTLACALARNPRLLLLDEPLTGVNPILRHRALSVIQSWSSNGGTVLFIEHDLDAVRALAQRVLVLAAGKLIYEGNPDSLSQSDEVKRAYLGTK